MRLTLLDLASFIFSMMLICFSFRSEMFCEYHHSKSSTVENIRTHIKLIFAPRTFHVMVTIKELLEMLHGRTHCQRVLYNAILSTFIDLMTFLEISFMLIHNMFFKGSTYPGLSDSGKLVHQHVSALSYNPQLSRMLLEKHLTRHLDCSIVEFLNFLANVVHNRVRNSFWGNFIRSMVEF